MIDTLNQWDHELMLWLNFDGGVMTDTLFYWISYKFTWIPFYATILYVLWLKSRAHALFWFYLLSLIVITVLVIVAADQVASGIIKPMVHRLRPSHEPGLQEMLHYVGDYRGGRYGFVSSHAANTIALTVWLSKLLRRMRIYLVMGLFYLFNCYSRIYLGVHFPGDILCGTIVGALCGWTGFFLYSKIWADKAPTAVGTLSASLICYMFLASMAVIAGAALLSQ